MLASLALLAAPVMVQAAEGGSLRAGSPVTDREELAGSGIGLLLGFAAALAALIVIAGGDDDGESESS